MVGNLTLITDRLPANAHRFDRRFCSAFPHGRGDLLLVLLAILNRDGMTCSQIAAALSLGIERYSQLLSLTTDNLVDHHRVPVNRSNRTLGGMCCWFWCFLGGQSRQSERNHKNSTYEHRSKSLGSDRPLEIHSLITNEGDYLCINTKLICVNDYE